MYGTSSNFNGSVLVMNIVVFGNVNVLGIKYDNREYVIAVNSFADVGKGDNVISSPCVRIDNLIILGIVAILKYLVLPGINEVRRCIINEASVIGNDANRTFFNAQISVSKDDIIVLRNGITFGIFDNPLEFVVDCISCYVRYFGCVKYIKAMSGYNLIIIRNV